MPGSLRRHRLTDAQAEAARLTTALAITLGGETRQERRRQRRTQQEIGDEIGVDQARVSQIERGHGENVPLERWVGLGVVLGRPLAVSFSKSLDPAAAVSDAGHLQIQEALLAMAARTGRRAAAELPTRPLDPRHSTDVALCDDTHRVLILIEAWNTFGDVGAAIRSTHRKQAEAEERATILGGDGPPYRVASVWIVRASATNRALIRRYPHLFAMTFDGSSRTWATALTAPVPPPRHPGLVWFDTATNRVVEWRPGPQREVKNSPSVFAEQLSSRQGRPSESWIVRNSE